MTAADLRRDYTLGGLTEDDAGPDPLTLFQRWFQTAIDAELPEPNAFTLATVTADGRPDARVVLLKHLDHGFTFFTNYNSRKAGQLAGNPHVCLVFLWYQLERQVRIEGVIEKVTAAESDAYFEKRPLGSRLGAWASPQSAVIPDRAYLEREQAELMAKYPDGQVPRPPHWGGYRVLPAEIEFWQGRQNRLHDRVRFRKTAGGWERFRLAP